MKGKIIAFILELSFIYSSFIKAEPVKVGNFAVRKAFQPGPLFARGQKMLDKNQLDIYEIIIHTKGKNCLLSQFFNHNLLYGISDRLSFLISPINGRFINTEKGKRICSSGFLDFPIAFEYAYYLNKKEQSVSQLTFLASILLPTGARFKNPPLGFNSPSFFLGLTARYLDIDWYLFADIFAWPKTKHRQTKYGDTIMYDWGIGHNIKHIKDLVLLFLLEFNGVYSSRDLVRKKVQYNTGGNFIFAGPSLWISSNNLKIQGGIQWPIFQQLFGKQNKRTFRFGIYITIGLN